MMSGLSSREAAELLAKFGPNDPAPARRSSRIFELGQLFVNPLVIILLFAAGASAMLGQYLDAGIIVVVVLVSIGINFIQTYRSQVAAEHLRNRVLPTATVSRDGKFIEIHRSEVVPGDLVRLSAGDLVPADARLVESRDLYVQQAAMTGESSPAEKEATGRTDGADSPDTPNMVFLGTSVISGAATAIVVNTGPRTLFGDIARRLAVHPEETEFERGLRQFGALIMRAVFFLVLFIMVVSISLRHDAFESLLFAVALAVGLTPEFLPMITSVTLARGALRMAEQKVIVKQLSAIQNFGSIDILCSDKTGTITTGVMTVDCAVDAFGQPSVEVLRRAWLNANFETGIRNPLNIAILRDAPQEPEGFRKLDEIPFDFERRRVSIVVDRGGDRGRDRGGDQGGEPGDDADPGARLLIVKGAPEGILHICTACLSGSAVLPWDESSRARCQAAYDDLSARGLRVLAVAFREVGDQKAFTPADERDLTLIGLIGFVDPPIEGAADVIAALKRDGVQVKIITGDGELVTRHICQTVGLDSDNILLGDDMLNMSDSALDHVVEKTHIFARVSPAQKTRILLALKHRSHVVGYMGDGINDAPSLRAADVGISVSTAVDVARDAAQIILVEPGLHILHQGIMEGRRAFGNVDKYLLMGTSSNFGNMFSMAGASLFLPFLPMLPTQILLNNFLYDLAQITIPSDNVDDEYIRTPQRWNISQIRNFMLLIGPISSLFDFLTFLVMIKVFHATEILFHTGWFVESLATQTLVLFVIRTRKRPWKSRPSLPLSVTTLVIVLVGLILPVSPLARILGFTPLPPAYFLFLVAATATYLSLVEIAKERLFRRHQRTSSTEHTA
jgi:Mg2+-importing ATPase